MCLIRLKQAHTRFPLDKNLLGRPRGWIRAVNGVDLTIREGECLGLVGESGCGKSTLGRTIFRLAPLYSGEIYFKDREIGGLDAAGLKPFRSAMQMVFQDPKASLNPRMTVFRILEEALRLDTELRPVQYLEKAVELVELVDLRAEHIFRYPHEFSGGQQQRISIARALATNPRFIVFDEATSALDVSVQAQIITLMGRLKETLNLTYLFISHDLSILEHACDRVAVMYAGQIVEIQAAEHLFNRPRHPYTHALRRAIPLADPDARFEPRVLAGEVPKLTAPPTGCFFHPRCDFRQDICVETGPEFERAGDHGRVRCHFYETLESSLTIDKESFV